MAIPVKKQSYIFADYITWSQNDRCEIIEGEIVAMSPPSRIHQEIVGELFLQIGNYLKGKEYRVYVTPFDVVLINEDQIKENSKNVVQPDITIVCDSSKLDDQGCIGTPDMVVEVVSPSTASHDYVKKLNLYEEYCVKEYWIINPKKRNVFIYRLDDNKTYSDVNVYDINEKIEVGIFENLEIDLSTIINM